MFKIRYSHLAKRRMRIAPIFHNTGLIQSRSIRLSAEGVRVAKNYRYIMSVLAGVYVGVGIVSLGSFYFMYHDADTRQPIPFELSFQNQVTAVKAINKDDALKSPRYAVKHYRRLLIELAKEVDPSVDENSLGPFEVPIIDSDTLVHKKSNKFSNFYIDIVLRYAKALLAKGQLEVSMNVLSKIINDDILFYKLGDTEKLAAGSRLLAKVSPDPEQKQYYLKRAINMLRKFYPSIIVDQDYVLAENSNISDEILNCLNDLAFQYASASKSTKNKKQKEELLSNSLKIYLANLRCLNIIREALETQTKTQVNFPWFNCDRENLIISICELRAHISEVMWAKGFKKNAIGWSEEVVEEIYYDRQSSAKASPLLINVLNNLVAMYDDIKDTASKNRCEKLRSELKVFDFEVSTKWYDDLIKKWSNIMYKDGPIEILAKPLRERFGFGERVLDIEEYEDEDVE